MKVIFALVVLMSAGSVFAQQKGEKFICREITEDSWDPAQKMILTQIGSKPLREGEGVYPFTLEYYSAENHREPILSEFVWLQVEDVMVKFKTKSSNTRYPHLEGIIYLDEPEDTWLQLDNRKKKFIRFNCA